MGDTTPTGDRCPYAVPAITSSVAPSRVRRGIVAAEWCSNRGASWELFDEIPGVFLYALEVAGDKLFAARIDGLWWTPVVTAPVEETTWGSIKSRLGR